MLAIRRGTREGILNFSIDVDNTKCIVTLLSRIIRDPQSRFAPFLDTAVRDAYDRLLLTSIQNEVRSILKENAESEAIKVFEDNLRTLLLAPPAGHLPVTGIDPGQRTGCKVAVVDETGKFLENQTIYPTEPKQDLEGSEKTLLDLTQKYNVRGIAIGNGTASRETDAFVRAVVEKNKLKRILAWAVESCVNRVGVDLNSSSVDLLKYVSGIGDKLAQNVVAYRDQHGLFCSRTQIREIEGFGDKTFEQAAGFLR